MGQAYARNNLLDWADDLQLGIAPDPADVLHRLQMDVLQSVPLHPGLEELRGLPLPLRAAKPGAKLIAERDQRLHHLSTRIAVTDHPLVHIQKPVSLCHDLSLK